MLFDDLSVISKYINNLAPGKFGTNNYFCECKSIISLLLKFVCNTRFMKKRECQSQAFSNTIFRWYSLGKFYMVKFNYFSGRTKSKREVLKFFWLTIMRVIYEINVLLTSIKKYSYQCHPHYAMQVSSHSVLYLQFFGSHNIRIYMYYLSLCNRGLFKSYDLGIRKALQILWKMFLIPSLYIL